MMRSCSFFLCSTGGSAGRCPCTPQGISSLDPIAEVVGWINKQFPAGAGELSVTRTDPISKERLSYCELVAHCRTTGRRRNAANRMQSIRGKQQKRRWRKLVSIHAFFLFSLRPWVRIFRSSSFMRNKFVFQYFSIAGWVQGGILLPRGEGYAQAPFRSSSFVRKPVCFASLYVAGWVQGESPCRGVKGTRRPLHLPDIGEIFRLIFPWQKEGKSTQKISKKVGNIYEETLPKKPFLCYNKLIYYLLF